MIVKGGLSAGVARLGRPAEGAFTSYGISKFSTLYWDSQYYYYQDEDDNILREGYRGNYYVIDRTLTELGFDGDEDTDWENIKCSKIYPQIPTNVTLTLISRGVKIDWTAEADDIVEIWGQSEGADYTLLYTIDAGIYTKDDIIPAVSMRYYKLRSYNNLIYSEFTEPVSIAMLGSNIITNTGTPDTTDWIDSNSDGLADEFYGKAGSWSTPACEIITGGGFSGNAQRMNPAALGARVFHSLLGSGLVAGHSYRFRFKLKSNNNFRLYTKSSAELIISQNSTNEVLTTITCYYTVTTGTNLCFYGGSAGYFEIDEFEIKEVLMP